MALKKGGSDLHSDQKYVPVAVQKIWNRFACLQHHLVFLSMLFLKPLIPLWSSVFFFSPTQKALVPSRLSKPLHYTHTVIFYYSSYCIITQKVLLTQNYQRVSKNCISTSVKISLISMSTELRKRCVLWMRTHFEEQMLFTVHFTHNSRHTKGLNSTEQLK